MSDAPPIVPELAPLAFLLGTWAGEGRGEYPSIEPFAYTEEATFSQAGRPFLAYVQRTRRLDTGLPSHAETGYWRPAGEGRLEAVLAHPTGVVEVTEGAIDGTRIELSSTTVAGTATAKDVTALERVIEVDGDVLRYEVRMAAVGRPLRHHLSAELHRTH